MEAYPLPEFNIELHVTPSIGVLLVCGRIRGSLSYYAVLLILQAGPEKGLVVVDPHNGSYLAVASVSTGCSLVSCLVEQSLPPYNTAGTGAGLAGIIAMEQAPGEKDHAGQRPLSSTLPMTRPSRFAEANHRPVSSRPRSRSPLEKEPPGHGERAKDLLGGEHGSAWDMLRWANAVLERSPDASAAASAAVAAASATRSNGGIAGTKAGSSPLPSPTSREFTK